MSLFIHFTYNICNYYQVKEGFYPNNKRWWNTISKKIIISNPYNTKVLDYDKDWMMLNYYIIMNGIGSSLKWYQKLPILIFCKIIDLHTLIMKGLKKRFDK